MSAAISVRRAIIGLTIGLTIAGCAAQPNAGDTDDFLRNAFDAYGVIDVVPAQNTRPAQVGQPLDATNTLRQVATPTTPPMS